MNINRIKQLFVSLAKEIRAEGNVDLRPGMTYNDYPMKIQGDLILMGESVGKYSKAFQEIVVAATPLGTWSVKSLDEVVSQRLSAAISGDDSSGITLASERLIKELQRDPKMFPVKIAVFGMGPDCSGLAFGEIIFTSETYTPPSPIPGFFRGEETKILLASLNLPAIDEDTALELASSRVDRHLAVLNALCSDYSPSTVRITRTFTSNFVYTMQEIGTSRINSSESLVRPVHRAELDGVMQKRGGNLLGDLLRSESSLALRIVSAFETAGAASMESQSHIAFLLFAIALESAVLGKQNHEELTLQLAVRVAHLLSEVMTGRRDVVKRVKHLYRT